VKFTGENVTEVTDYLITHRQDPGRLQLRHAVGTKSGELDKDGKPKEIPVIIFGNAPVAVVSVLVPGSVVEYDQASDTFAVTNP
jgi:hypothetical protein